MKIDEIVARKGFTGYALSKATGLSKMAIKNVLDGNVSIEDMKVKSATRLANALGYTLDELLKKIEE